MIVAMTLDRPLQEAQRLVQSPEAFANKSCKQSKLQKLIQLRPDVQDDLSYNEGAPPAASDSSEGPIRITQNPLQPPDPEN